MMILKYPVYDYGYMPCTAYANRLIAAEERKTGRYPTVIRENRLRRGAQIAVCGAAGKYLYDRLKPLLEADSLMQSAQLTMFDLGVIVDYESPTIYVKIAIPDDTILSQAGIDELRSNLWNLLHAITMYDGTCQPFRDWFAALPENLPCT